MQEHLIMLDSMDDYKQTVLVYEELKCLKRVTKRALVCSMHVECAERLFGRDVVDALREGGWVTAFISTRIILKAEPSSAGAKK